MATDKGKYLSELRRSGAAGVHDHRPSRSETRRLAIEDSEDEGSGKVTGFEKGQRVRVEFEATINALGDETVEVVTDEGRWYNIPAEWLTVVGPVGWPPQPGDIWEAEGEEYSAHLSAHLSVSQLLLYPVEWEGRDGSSMVRTYSDRGAQRDLDDFRALNPVLVRRRGVK